MVYGSEAILWTNLDYGALRVRAYNEQGAEASLEDAMDRLDEERDQVPESVAPVPRPSGAGLGLQRQGLGAPPRPEQQKPPQALSAMGGTVRRRGGAPTGHLQAQDHRRKGLRQCLEHLEATSLLPLIYACTYEN